MPPSIAEMLGTELAPTSGGESPAPGTLETWTGDITLGYLSYTPQPRATP